MREMGGLVDWWYIGSELGDFVGEKSSELLSNGGDGSEVWQRRCRRPVGGGVECLWFSKVFEDLNCLWL